MEEKLIKLKKEILNKLNETRSLKSLDELEIKFLGRKGAFTKVLRSLKDLKEEEKRKVGSLANQIKKEVIEKISSKKESFNIEACENDFDITLPGERMEKGHLNPITIIQNELEDLFYSLGFTVLDGPELESDYYNFEALNVPPYHPARDMQDTFYIDPTSIKYEKKKNKDKNKDFDMVMRTQTSPMQVRAMREYGAPLRAIIPGRCFRSEATDVRHEHTFYQVEGIMVDKNIDFSHLKGVLEIVGKKLYGEDTELRMRPKFYPFVEPGANGEYTCFICKGKGCKLCKNTGWLEILGSGMVHPNVLKAGGIDPKKYKGFAFGFGLDRLVMLKYGIDDIRLFNGGDMRFLEQF
jgi:phenylalanyl-tRNA synthetase alpha chain